MRNYGERIAKSRNNFPHDVPEARLHDPIGILYNAIDIQQEIVLIYPISETFRFESHESSPISFNDEVDPFKWREGL